MSNDITTAAPWTDATEGANLAAEGLAGVPLEFTSEVAQGNVKAAMKTSGATSGDLWRVPVEQLHVMPGLNVRGETPEYLQRIESIARSILREGFYPDKALAVFVAEDGRIMVRDGHTRLRAVKRAMELGAQIKVLPCVTAPKGSTMEDFTVGLVKSNTGAALRPIEVAVVMKRLAGWGWDTKQIAERLDYSVAYVEELLGLLAGPKALVALVQEGKVSASTAVTAVKNMGAAEATRAIVEASAAKADKGGKVNASDIGQSKAQRAVKAAEKKAAATAPATSQRAETLKHNNAVRKATREEAMAPIDVDALKALRMVYDDPGFIKLSDLVQSHVIAALDL